MLAAVSPRELGLAARAGRSARLRCRAGAGGSHGGSLFEAMDGGSPHLRSSPLLRLAPLTAMRSIDRISFSGGVAEYIYGRETDSFGDLGPLSPRRSARASRAGPRVIEPPNEGIRATVIGASQYTIAGERQHDLRVAARHSALAQLAGDRAASRARRRGHRSRGCRAALRAVLKRLDLAAGESPVAVFVSWRGSATFDAARRILSWHRPRASPTARARPSPRSGRRRRRRRPFGHSLPRGIAARKRDRLDRRPRARGIRLYRYRRAARHLGRRAGRDQIAHFPQRG